VVKRVFDLLGATCALVLLAPLMVALAAWVKLDSPGPAIYRQERVGRHGRHFRIHKLRTMAHGAGGAPLTVGADPRVTRAGRVLRRTRLDELPQLIDVLLGDMSLVGPRPDVPRYMDQVAPALRERVLRVRPGVTDPVALAHLDEALLLARAADPEREYVQHILPAKLAAAADYAERATLASDLRVLAATLWRLLGGVGAGAGRRGRGAARP
jgi:lipopolysaccharide/colanic/teichoic acid biosynthesis glycosyltransferase